ncbi:MAG TPA: alpha/beta hydrolase [Patescibacteria group bacterium]|nr:alpha/beta hydrolase [Patescibacteria group bacterium]
MNKVAFLKIILIHGNGGSSANDNWFPYVKKELEKLNLKVVSKTFPDNKLARQEYWLPFLKDELKTDKNTILVGHSSGAVAAMRFAEKNKIYGSILIGASYTDLGEESEKVSGYFDKPWDWESIKNNQNWIIQFASTDDPYIPIAEARHIHEKLNTDYHEYNNRGHFSWDTGLKEFSELIEVIKKKIRAI